MTDIDKILNDTQTKISKSALESFNELNKLLKDKKTSKKSIQRVLEKYNKTILKLITQKQKEAMK